MTQINVDNLCPFGNNLSSFLHTKKKITEIMLKYTSTLKKEIQKSEEN